MCERITKNDKINIIFVLEMPMVGIILDWILSCFNLFVFLYNLYINPL